MNCPFELEAELATLRNGHAGDPVRAQLGVATHCDCCGLPMLVGADVACLYDERKGDGYAHWGRCPMSVQTIEIELRRDENVQRVPVRARVYGLWAMHRPLLHGRALGRGWAITHVLTGGGITGATWGLGGFGYRTAWRITAVLGETCSTDRFAALSARSPEADETRDIVRRIEDEEVSRG